MLSLMNNFFIEFAFINIDVPWSICRNEFKREGSGRGNWGAQTDELAQ